VRRIVDCMTHRNDRASKVVPGMQAKVEGVQLASVAEV
jgi:hypothetical protein